MDEMIPPNTQGIPITGNDPNGEVRISQLYPGSNGGSPAVNRMKTKGLHIIWEPAGTSNTGNKHNLFFRNSKVRKCFLYLG